MTAIKKQDNKHKPSAKQKKTVRYFQGVGRRKEAVAQARLYPEGSGSITINSKELALYFPYFVQQETVRAPLSELGVTAKYDVTVKVLGGGPRGQAEAVRLGIARALTLEDEGVRKPLKAKGYLKRDPRIKERKKPGLKRARRAPQWKKR